MEDIKIVKINEDMFKDIKSLVDFYNAIGLLDRTRYQKINVTRVFISPANINKIRELLFKNNYRKGNYRHYNKKNLKTIISWEMLYGSPAMSDLVPDDEIWLKEGWIVNV